MAENSGSDKKIETRKYECGKPKHRRDMPSAAAMSMTDNDFEARQAAIGSRRRYAGPVFDEVTTVPAALNAAMDDEDVEPTEIAPPTEEQAS